MTDNEIVKALECCMNGHCDDDCPFRKTREHCLNLDSLILNLINRQKAEIERLNSRKEVVVPSMRCVDGNPLNGFNLESHRFVARTVEDVKAEAYKEFAEKSEKEIFIKQDNERKQMLEILKTYRGTRTYSDTERATDNWLRGYGEAVQDILSINDNLLKEMVGENDVNEKAKE